MRRSLRIKTRTENSRKTPATSNEWNSEVVPLDLQIEILNRLPLKSVARFLLVSKSWERIIRSRDFINSFSFRSSLQPRLLVVFIDSDRKRKRQDWHFFSSSSSSTSYLSCVTSPFPNPQREFHPSHTNGFISLGYGQEEVISNPSSSKSITLPIVKTREMKTKSFFGYDLVNHQYKVLCMSVQPSCQHRVFTLGAKQESWRMIDCSIPHLPLSSNSVCIDGVVYYVANTGTVGLQWSLMRFDLRSEKLDLFTNLPADNVDQILYKQQLTLVNYQGKVAITTKNQPYTFYVWVIDQHAEKNGWMKKSFSIEPWTSLHIMGTTRTGEFTLAPRWYSEEFNVIHYNPDTNSFRNIKVEVNGDFEFKGRGTRAVVFSDYVESVMFL